MNSFILGAAGTALGALVGGPRGAAIGAGAGLFLGILTNPSRAGAASSVTYESLGQAALANCLAEKKFWGDLAPDTVRVDSYLKGCDPNGAELVAMNTDANRVNFCAASQGWAERGTNFFPHFPPWRAAAKQIMRDAQAGLRGPWHPAQELISNWRPRPGDLAIYWRGTPDGPYGHVRRVIRVVDLDHYEAIGANEGSRRWNTSVVGFWADSLLGFVEGGAAPTVPEVIAQEPNVLDFESPLTDAELASFAR